MNEIHNAIIVKRKIIFFSAIALVLLLGAIFFWQYVLRGFGAGSYPMSESYSYNISYNELVKTVIKFKDSNPYYKLPNGFCDDGKNDNNWYHIYFYYPNENQILHCVIQEIEREKSEILFTGVNQGLVLGFWKDINNDFEKDFNWRENRRTLKTFEARILNNLGIKYVSKRDNSLSLWSLF